MEVEMKIRGLMMDPATNMPIVILKDINSNTVLPIWVGIYEANAIALEIEKVSTPRPMTHDLMKSVLLGLRTGIQKVVVNELKEDTFYAVIWLERDVQQIPKSRLDFGRRRARGPVGHMNHHRNRVRAIPRREQQTQLEATCHRLRTRVEVQPEKGGHAVGPVVNFAHQELTAVHS